MERRRKSPGGIARFAVTAAFDSLEHLHSSFAEGSVRLEHETEELAAALLGPRGIIAPFVAFDGICRS